TGFFDGPELTMGGASGGGGGGHSNAMAVHRVLSDPDAACTTALHEEAGRTALTPPMSRLSQYGGIKGGHAATAVAAAAAAAAEEEKKKLDSLTAALGGDTIAVLPASGMIFVPDQTQAPPPSG
ncbi:hypothetical protein BGZ73_001571, partial [Actinomortierella ambigua]